MTQAAAIRRRKQAANGYEHLPKMGCSIYPAPQTVTKGKRS